MILREAFWFDRNQDDLITALTYMVHSSHDTIFHQQSSVENYKKIFYSGKDFHVRFVCDSRATPSEPTLRRRICNILGQMARKRHISWCRLYTFQSTDITEESSSSSADMKFDKVLKFKKNSLPCALESFRIRQFRVLCCKILSTIRNSTNNQH